MEKKIIVLTIVDFIILLGVIAGLYHSLNGFYYNEKIPYNIYSSLVINSASSQELEEKIIFVGDIMLDRGVEYLMNKNTIFYPFEKISNFLKDGDIVFGNLEGPIVKKPKYFSDSSLKFAFSSEAVKTLSSGNINLVSLANNHTLDMGKTGLLETKEFLAKNNINFVGDTVSCSQDFSFQKDNLIFLAINKTFPFNCKDKEIVETIKAVRVLNPNKILIVSFHWGQEYQLKESTFQQELAHKVIDSGADLVIGHHPHVVQGIEEYKGKLIFYSLGNFVFDQYFSKETQESLAVGLDVYPQKLIFRLFPIKSHLAQPSLMDLKQAEEFLEKLAQRSDNKLLDSIKIGEIEIDAFLNF